MEEERDYYEIVEQFLKRIYPKNVGGVVLVAILEDDEEHDVIANWNVTPFGLAMASGMLQMQATLKYMELNAGEDDDENE